MTRITDGKEGPLPGAVTFGKTASPSVRLALHPRAKKRPSQLMIRKDAKGALALHTPYQTAELSLPIRFSPDFEGIRRGGVLSRGFILQAGEYDITGDKEPEIVVAVGDGLIHLEVNIFQYQPTGNKTGMGVWKRIGSFSGQSKAILEGDSVLLPYGSQGLFEQQQWKAGAFAPVN